MSHSQTWCSSSLESLLKQSHLIPRTIIFIIRICCLYCLWSYNITIPPKPVFLIVTILTCYHLSSHSLKPQISDKKTEVVVTFVKESGKKIIDPGNNIIYYYSVLSILLDPVVQKMEALSNG